MLNRRPFTVLGILAGIHSLLYGIGLMIPTAGFGDTQIYRAIQDFPVITPFEAGVAGIIVGLVTILSFITRRDKLVDVTAYLNTVFWLFVTFIYFQAGHEMLALSIGACWAFFCWYTGYLFRCRKLFQRLASEQ